VSDLIDGLTALMSYEGQDAAEPVNLGSSEEKSMLEVVDCLSTILQRKLDIDFRPLPGDDPQRRRPDTTRAKSRLNWQPRVPLLDGLRETVEFFRREISRAPHSRR
jgi:UDP-glucuronate decarboxylase